MQVSGHPPGVNQRLHWQARRRLCRPFVDAIGWQAKAFGLEQPLERARVVVTFIHRSRRYMGDVDNLYSRSKCLVDALKGILVVDDSTACLELEVRQELGKERSVRVEVWSAA
jgi:Holliday junction resolvase RusA-like endonuclease